MGRHGGSLWVEGGRMDDIVSVSRPAVSEPTEPTRPTEPTEPQTPESSTPQVFAGRYRVTGELGHGGMADVYAAIDEVLRRRVAVKVFRPGPDSAADRERFHVEVRTMAGLTHPNLVSLYDGGQDVTSPWCVMQLLDGGTLADLTDPLPADRVAELGAQLADGLAYIHQQGIVHRDLKPSNVLLDGEGAAYLSDFGVAQMVDASRLTASGAMIGTAAFLAPEQVLGAPVGPPVDVYALGLVLLEALTRRREYPGGPVESALARLARPPRIPASLGTRLVELLGAMTSTDPAGRPSAAAVAQMLRAVADERFVTDQLPTLTAAARPAGPATEQDPVSRRWPARRTVGLRRGALGVLAAASVAVALSVALHTPGAAVGGNVSGPVVVTPTGAPPNPVVAAEPGTVVQPVELPDASTAAVTGPASAGVVKPVGPGPAQVRPATNPRPPTAAGITGGPSLVPTPVLSPVPSPTGKPSPNPSPTPSIRSTPSPTGSPSSVGPSPKPSTSTASPSPASPRPASPTPGITPSPTSV